MREPALGLQRASVVPAAEIAPDVITMNSKVRLLDLDRGTALEYTLVYPEDADFAKGKISVLAPIGAAMLGYRVGDEIEWMAPGGLRRFRVEGIDDRPEAAGDYSLRAFGRLAEGGGPAGRRPGREVRNV